VALRGWVMTSTPIAFLAIHFEMAREMSEAAKSEQGCEYQQAAEAAAPRVEILVDAEEVSHHGQDDDDCEVGSQRREEYVSWIVRLGIEPALSRG